MTVYQFERNELSQTPWKNGGGTTREIYKSKSDEPFWRLSIADVDSDGPFSLFPGMFRILTVIEGNGIRLVGETRSLEALKHNPVHFSGEEQIQGTLIENPIQDLNLIFDDDKWAADARVGRKDTLQVCMKDSKKVRFLYCLEGRLMLNRSIILREHQGVFSIDETDTIELSPSSDGKGLYISLSHREEIRQ